MWKAILKRPTTPSTTPSTMPVAFKFKDDQLIIQIKHYTITVTLDPFSSSYDIEGLRSAILEINSGLTVNVSELENKIKTQEELIAKLILENERLSKCLLLIAEHKHENIIPG